MLGGLLVDISLGVVAGLVDLVSEGVLRGSGAAGEGCVSVLGDRLGGGVSILFVLSLPPWSIAYLVGLLGSLGAGALDGLSDVVCGVLDGLHFDLSLVGWLLVWFVCVKMMFDDEEREELSGNQEAICSRADSPSLP